MRVLITGVTAIHGWPIYQKLCRVLPPENILAIGSPKMRHRLPDPVHGVCVTDGRQLKRLNDDFQATHVIHGGGVCDLDVCEARPGWARRMNVGGARTIMELFDASCHITYISSDLVFSGNHTPPGGYREHHLPDPVSVVGKTYQDAEAAIAQNPKHCIVRMGLPLGPSFTGGKGALDWIENRFRKDLPVTLFFDEIRSCIPCLDLADAVFQLSANQVGGLYHCGGRTGMSLYDIGETVLFSGGYPKNLLRRSSRLEDLHGPPRIGDVTLCSARLEKLLEDFRQKDAEGNRPVWKAG